MIDIDLDAEQALLGSLLLDSASWGNVEDLFISDMFGLSNHRAVAASVEAWQRKTGSVDPVLVAGSLRDVGESEAADLTLELVQAIGTSSGARQYAERIRSLWSRREAKRIAAEIIESEADGEEMVSKAMEQLSRLELGKVSRPRTLGELIYERIEVLDKQNKAGKSSLGDSYPTGFRKLDHLIDGIRPGVPVLIASRPSVGKSALASAIIDNLASHGVRVGVFQLEDEGSALADRAIARRARIASTLLRHGAQLRGEHWDRLMKLDVNLPIWVDDDKSLSARQVASRMRRMVREHKINVFVIDHLGEMDMEQGRQERWDTAIGRSFRALRKAAHDLGTGLVCMHQMNRDVERRDKTAPRLSDLKDSGDLEAIARVVMFLSRPENLPGQFVIDVAKNTSGPLGRCVLSWLEDYMAVEEAK